MKNAFGVPSPVGYAMLLICALGYQTVPAYAAEAPPGSFSNTECVGCHTKISPQVVDDWRASVHARQSPIGDCVACHGTTHAGALIKARRSRTCIACHGGQDSSVVRSYTTSKHGILVRLEEVHWDWSEPLNGANYRAPNCAYCHLHQGSHNVGSSVAPWNPLQAPTADLRDKARDAMRTVCQDCHAPRYVEEMLSNEDRMLEVGHMKLREAAGVLTTAEHEMPKPALGKIERLYNQMQAVDMNNLRDGVAHQSPDYQWWYGHPALDGDLLRVKGELGQLRRARATLPATNAAASTGSAARPTP